jgi:Kef-type K+ transport system membrane component KefB
LGNALLSIGLLLITAKLLEGVAIRLRQSPLLAYLAAGIILGPALGRVEPTDELHLFFGIGVILMFFLIGIDEMDVSGLMATIRGRFFIAGFIAFVVPAGISFSVMLFVVDEPLPNSIALAGLLSLSSLAVVAKILSDMGRLKDHFGLEVFTTVVIVEIIGLLVVAFSLQQIGQSSVFTPWKIPLLLLEIVAFAVLAWFLASRVFPPLVVRLRRFIGAPQLTFGLVIGGLFLMVGGVENIGVHGALGGLLLGMALSGLPHGLRSEILPGVRGLAQGIFIPLFFASAGLYLNLSFTELPLLIIISIVLAAVLGKFVGAILGVVIARLDHPVAIASGLMGKGVVEIALLLVMLDIGAISPELFSLLTLLMVCFILLAGPAISIAIRRTKAIEKPKLPRLVVPSFARYVKYTAAVKDIMNKSRQFPSVKMSVQEFIDMWVVPEQQHYVVVNESHRLGGIVYLPDLRHLPKNSWKETILNDLIERDPPVALPDEPLDDVLERMANNNISVIPVISPESGELISSISSGDVVSWVIGAEPQGVRSG